jgi:hypothetical protein
LRNAKCEMRNYKIILMRENNINIIFVILLMGVNQSINKINFIDVQKIVNHDFNSSINISNISNIGATNRFFIINTLDVANQECLLPNTVHASKEADLINELMTTNKNAPILIYGENCCDLNVVHKYNQLYKLGFVNLYVYIGGLFEWLLLQDIYGDDEFPTTTKIIDILKYKGPSKI